MENIFDAQVLDSLYAAIGESVNKVIAIYVDDVPKNIQQMREALAKQDFETVGRLAHSLKSSSGNLGATQIAQLSIDLEAAINQGVTQNSDLLEIIHNLEASFNRIKPQVLSYIR